MRKLKPIMLGGAGSDVGKSMIAAGLCRIFRQDGYCPAPFKAQNMALNSYVTPDGLEIGRAQAVQAEAAGIECSSDMNPVLLKPSGHHTSQVVLNGLPIGNSDARDYFKADNRSYLRQEAHEAFDRLAEKYNPIVMEGAGSVAELNLMKSDIVNMSMAKYAGASVILVVDIDRGGVFASAFGSVKLQPEEYKGLIRGIIVNKFRGDETLFTEGRKILEDICGVPVIGVVPYLDNIHIEEEDSVSLVKKHSAHGDSALVNVAVVELQHISNFTDFDSLSRDPRVHLYFTASTEELRYADVIILPGSKNTVSDLVSIRESGVAGVILDHARRGGRVAGICGGYQMLGMEVSDPDGVEGKPRVAPGLSLLPMRTVLSGDKILRRVSFRVPGDSRECHGYEIHNGRSEMAPGADTLFETADGTEGCRRGTVIGSYIHGMLDNIPVIEMLTREVAASKSLPVESGIASYHDFKEEQYDRLADILRGCLDMEKVYKIMSDD